MMPERVTLAIDLAANRAARKYSRAENVRRVFWSFGRWLLVLSPRPMFGWRRFVLRLFGARVAEHVHVYPSTGIFMPWNLDLGPWATLGDESFIYNLGHVRFGARATLSYRAHVCAGTHDFSRPDLPLLKPPVSIEDDAWIGTDAFVGPGVKVGRGAIVGARAVVVDDVPPMRVVAGHPARVIGERPAAFR